MRYLFLLLIPFLVACESLPTPETQNQRLVVLEYSYQAALKNVDQLRATGVIKGGDREEVAQIIEQVGAAVRAARLDGGTNAINLANSLIVQLINYLQTKEGKQSWAPMHSLHSRHYQLSSQRLAPQVRQQSTLRRHWNSLTPKDAMLVLKN